IVMLSMAGMRHVLRLSMLESFPAPADSALDLGPFSMFIVSTVLTIIAIIYMFRLARAPKARDLPPSTIPQRGDS
ncbi:MAG: hypothetical protein ACRCR4_02205, partial [Thiotrichaceae bacterium]